VDVAVGGTGNDGSAYGKEYPLMSRCHVAMVWAASAILCWMSGLVCASHILMALVGWLSCMSRVALKWWLDCVATGS
jgi:hypothetical protein